MAVLIDYKKAHFEYEVLEKYEAGLELLGFEVKSLKGKHGSLDGAYVLVKGGEAWIQNMLIPPYQEKNTPADYDPRRHRRLLMNKKEIAAVSDTGKGLTVVPISVYIKNNLIKVTVAVVRGKKKYDKRETTKRREGDREMERTLKNN